MAARTSACGAAGRATCTRSCATSISERNPDTRADPLVNVLGIWDGHDAGAALLDGGRVRIAINEERLTRRKLEVRFPERSIAVCLSATELAPASVTHVAATTTDPAKTLGRWWPGSKERYYA